MSFYTAFSFHLFTIHGDYMILCLFFKEGLLVAVSPLVTIHNETGLLMELRFQRLQPKEDEFASVSLKPGDSIDDSMATFQAIKFSGGVKRALMSLTVGMHCKLLVLLSTTIPFLTATVLLLFLFYLCA